VGINAQLVSNRILISPNPAPNECIVSIQMEGRPHSFFDIEILNSMGQSVMKPELTNDHNQLTLDVSGLNPGVYLISVKTNNETLTRKFIKQ
jgi:hypothetical protein